MKREQNRSFFRDRVRTLKRGFRRERSKLRFRFISRRMLWLSSSVQTKLGVNLDFSTGARWIADIDRDATPVLSPPLEFSASCLKDFSSFGCRRSQV